MMRSTVAVCAALLLAACGADERGAAGPTVRDSAGIRIVQNDAPAWKRGDGWRLSAQPATDVGVDEGDASQQFGYVADALRLSDGTLLVADGQANEIRAFDARGRYLRTIARAGSGPGEFRGLSKLYLLAGDTVAAFDYRGGRVSYFSPSGAFVRAVTLQPLNGTLPPMPLGFFSDGRAVVKPHYNPVFSNSPKPTRDTIALALYSPAGAQAASLGRVPGDESVTLAAGEGENRMAMRDTPPFGLATSFAVQGTRMLVGDPARYELVERSPDGAVRRLIRRAGAPDPVTSADRDAYLERLREARRDPRFRQLQEKLLAGMVFPERKPYFAALAMDPAGHAWVQRFATGEGDTPWDVFDPEGRLLGTLAFPPGHRVTQVGTDFITTVWMDELDVAHVRVYRIEKPAPR